MKMNLQKVTRLLSHKFTFHFGFIMFIMLAGSSVVKAQGGQFQFSGLSAPDPVTRMQRCTLSWTDHAATISSINANISFSVFPVCVDVAATLASMPPDFSGFTNVSSTGINISKLNGPDLNVTTNHPIFIIIYISGPPSEAITFSGGGFLGTPINTFPITNASATRTFAPGISLSGVAEKVGGTPCMAALNNWIPGVQFTIDRVVPPGSTACYAGPAMPASQTPIPPYSYYLFENLAPGFSYNISASKNTGCECGPLGPVDNLDKMLARNYILGIGDPISLVQAHAGDYDADGTLDTYDVTWMSKCQLGEPTLPSVWRFAAIIESSTFSNSLFSFINPLPPLPPAAITLNDVTVNEIVDFVGIKRGDVNQSCSACGGNLTHGNLEERNEIDPVFKGIVIAGKSMEAGQEMLIPVLASDDLKGLAIYGIELAAGSKIQLLEVQDKLQKDDYSDYRIRQEGGRDILHYEWFNMTNGGKNIAKGEVLFYVRVQALDKIQDMKEELFLLPFSGNNNLFYENGNLTANWHLSEGIDTRSDRLTAFITGGNQLSAATAQVKLYLPQNGQYRMMVSDMSGNVASIQTFDAQEKGWILKEVAVPENTGVYQLTITSPSERHTIRFVKY